VLRRAVLNYLSKLSQLRSYGGQVWPLSKPVSAGTALRTPRITDALARFGASLLGRTVGLMALSALLAFGHWGSFASAQNVPVEVVVTIPPLADWVQQVGGERVRVTTLLTPGTSPHTFEPSPAEMRKISTAQLFVQVGLGLDDWGARLAKVANGKVRVLSLGEYLRERKLLPDIDELNSGTVEILNHAHASHESDHTHGHYDPHFWLDPHLAQQCVEEIRNQLKTIDATGVAEYDANCQRYVSKLATLDRELREELRGCTGKGMVNYHNAFAYFARRYGLRIAGVIEEYAGKTPSERYLRELTREVKKRGVSVIFAEPQFNPRLAEILATEAGARVETLDPLGSGKPGSYEFTLRELARKIRQALCP